MLDNLTKKQLEVALHYLFSAIPGKIPKILEKILTNWINWS